MLPEQLWNATLGELELELSKANFTTWFEDTFILQIGSGTVTIGVPSAFTKTWLEKKYHQSIVKALRRIADEDVRMVTYEVASKQKQDSQDSIEPNSFPSSHSSTSDQKKPSSSPQDQNNQTSNTSAGAESVKPMTVVEKNTATIHVRSTPEDQMERNNIGLNPRYTFENFVVGKKNELAHAACLGVAEQPGHVYNPLFIYGGVGLGKTHLMQAVGHSVLQRFPEKKILYVTCEAFTTEFIRSVGEGHAEQFKDKYRSVDILMVDDIQFLAGKEGTQEQFFHTFNHLYQGNKQVILTSDRPPRAIPTLENRLISRFEGGMIVDVNTPDLETRIAILKHKCDEKGYVLHADIMQFIASNVQNNIRELEGALNRVIAYHQLNKEEPTLQSVQSLLSSFSQSSKRGAVTTKKILSTVSEYFEVNMDDLKGDSRKKELVVPRQIAMHLMREEIHASYPNIGQELGGRDHTTAMHACQKISKLIEEDEKITNDINMIKQRLYN